MRRDKYNISKKDINRQIREDKKMLVNYTDLVLTNDKLMVEWKGKNFVLD